MALTYALNVQDNASATFSKVTQNVNILNQSLVKADKTTNIFGKSLSFLGTASANFLGNVMASAAGKIKDLAKEMVDSYDSAAKLSNNIGVAADSILGLRYAANLSHVSTEQLDKNMVKLSKAISEAASGSEGASDTFKKMGIEVKNTDGSVKNSEQVLMEMADAFQKLPAGAQRATLAMDVFGKSGASMVTMLKDGSGALRQMTDDGKLAAGDVDSIAVAMQGIADAGTKAKTALMGFMATLADTKVLEMAIDLANDLSDAFLRWRKASAADKEKEKTKHIAELTEATKKYNEQLGKVAEAEASLAAVQGMSQEYGLEKTITEKQKQLAAAQKDLEKLETQMFKLDFSAQDKKIELIDREQSKLEGMKQAYAELKKTSNSTSQSILLDLKEQIRQSKNHINNLKEEAKTTENNKRAAANTITNYGNDKKDEEAAKRKAEAATKLYEAETKKLTDWLDTYRNSKRTESEIAEDAYKKEIANLDSLLARKKISQTEHSVYVIQAEEAYSSKISDIGKKYHDEKIKSEEAAQSRVLELRKISTSDSRALMDIEIAQIEARYATEIRLADKALIDTGLIEQAKAAEVAGLRARAMETELQMEQQQAEQMRSFREAAAQTEAEQMEIQKERINAKYDAELAKAKENAEMITAIERARHAEMERMENQMLQLRLSQAQQYIDSYFQVATAIGTLGKASGNTMKAISITQAIINTALAATKASTAAPWPMNMALVAGAVAQGMVQIATMKAQKFYAGGMIRGGSRLIRANEEGEEAILNTRAVRAIGGEAGVNALNRGSTTNNYNSSSASSTIVINTSIMTQKAYRDEIEPVLRNAERRR